MRPTPLVTRNNREAITKLFPRRRRSINARSFDGGALAPKQSKKAVNDDDGI